MAGRSTTGAVYSIRILMEKHRESKTDHHKAFIDLEKAFDRVLRKLIWHALRAQGVAGHCIILIKEMKYNVTYIKRSKRSWNR